MANLNKNESQEHTQSLATSQKIDKMLFSKKISTNSYLLYNSRQHIPAKFSKKGKFYVETILMSDGKLSKALEKIDRNERKDFREFYHKLKENDFLNFDDTPLENRINDKEIMKKKKTFYLFITDNCNLNCSYCFNKDIRTNFANLPIEGWKKIINKIRKHIGTIIITGGEPSLYQPLPELIEYIKEVTSNDVYINMFTNGNIPFYADEERYKKILKGIDKLSISCDNISDNNQKRIGFSIDTFLKNIDWLKSNGYSEKIVINSVYSKGSISNILEVKSFAQKNEIKFSYALQLPSKKSDKKYMPQINELKKCVYNNVLGQNSSKKQSKLPITIKCSAATTIFSIDSQGNCYPCQNFHFPEFYLGNILNEAFENIFFAEPSKIVRNHTIYKVKECNECNLKYICGGGCISDTFKLHKAIDKHPSIMCPYYKVGAINRLLENEYN
ncbi:MAG: radical SAM protein [Bacteroidales bacterium]|nr:radical SAM protein [Bacteroidales bacterium]